MGEANFVVSYELLVNCSICFASRFNCSLSQCAAVANHDFLPRTTTQVSTHRAININPVLSSQVCLPSHLIRTLPFSCSFSLIFTSIKHTSTNLLRSNLPQYPLSPIFNLQDGLNPDCHDDRWRHYAVNKLAKSNERRHRNPQSNNDNQSSSRNMESSNQGYWGPPGPPGPPPRGPPDGYYADY